MNHADCGQPKRQADKSEIFLNPEIGEIRAEMKKDKMEIGQTRKSGPHCDTPYRKYVCFCDLVKMISFDLCGKAES